MDDLSAASDEFADLGEDSSPRPRKPAIARPWHAGRILFALANHFYWFQNRLIPEFELDGLREDLVAVSRSGYATVIEIKVTRSDWLADRWKRRDSPHVARFFYAVPLDLYEKGIPEHVPDSAGILVCRPWPGRGDDTIAEVRPAKRRRAERLTDAHQRAIDAAFYFRFWRAHMKAERARLYPRRNA